MKMSGLNKKKIIAVTSAFVIMASAWVICGIFFGKPECREEQVYELKRIENYDARWYEIEIVEYDGKICKGITHKATTWEKKAKDDKTAREILKTVGKRTFDFTSDKIKYPIYAFEIEPWVDIADSMEHGEMMVWTNGYLITACGNVYECDIDFDYFMIADDEDYSYEFEPEGGIKQLNVFRPLKCANRKWNKEWLSLSPATGNAIEKDVEATVVSVYEENGYPVVDILLNNTGDTEWRYEERSIFVGLSTLIDGEWYAVPADPSVDAFYGTPLNCSSKLGPGMEVINKTYIGKFGELPPGDYRIVISGVKEGISDYACADYHID